LRLTKGNKALTARILGIDPSTVARKLKAGGVEEGGGPEGTGAGRPVGS
jgi:hypothetical protein